MCGLTGIFNVNGKPVAIETLRRMTDAVAHRGPDGEGFWTENFVGFGHRRLAIIDLSPLGHQPMQSIDRRFVIVFNGEIYNFAELRTELEELGYRFRSKSDTEVILNAYAAWGKDCVIRLNGMFAFAIWDAQRHELFIARDRHGLKPLYYSYKNGTLLFGSEIKSLLKHPDISVQVSIPALNEYFSFQNIFTDRTLFDGISLLPPAHILTLRLGASDSLRIQRYWDYSFVDEQRYPSENEYKEELDRLFAQAVRRQLVSDVEVGTYLSGGMDSGAVTCLAARQCKHIKSFTCGFDLSSASGMELSFDERQKAEFLSNLYKTEHYEVVLKAGDMERIMPELIWHLEDLRIGQCYPNYYVSRLASKFVKVVLSGAGGDEIFAGYPWRYYRAAFQDDPEAYFEKYYRFWHRLIADSDKPRFYQPEIYPTILQYPTKDVFRSVMKGRPIVLTSPEHYVNSSLYFEIRTFMHGLLVVEDKLSMAHGLETRAPFLDNDLVDFGTRIPVRYQLKDLQEVKAINENEPRSKARLVSQQMNDGKLLLRKMLERYVPQDYTGGVKQGFSAPDASWFKGESIEYIRRLVWDPRARIYEYLQPARVHELLGEHFEGKQNRRLLIWSLLCFEWWLRTFDKRGVE